jgi:hypothetical protein
LVQGEFGTFLLSFAHFSGVFSFVLACAFLLCALCFDFVSRLCRAVASVLRGRDALCWFLGRVSTFTFMMNL